MFPMPLQRCCLFCLLSCFLVVLPAAAQRQMEKLGRGVVVLHSATSQAYVGWRLLATDPTEIGFNVYRSANGGAGLKLNSQPLTNTTDFLDTTANFSVSNSWSVVPVINGVEGQPGLPYGLAANYPVRQYLPLPLVVPGPYPPYDVKFCWVGDFDGDGEYDFLMDRLSTTGGKNQFLQAYKRDGTLLWQMDMGFNSTNTANAYEPDAAAICVGDKDNVTVYDLDGDGRAEVIVRTANGTILPDGSLVTTNNNTSQFLCILDGLTGAEKARALIPNPYFADGPLNCHAGIVYFDGIHPSILFSGENRVGSGAFQRLAIAWDFRDGKLTQRWLYQTPNGQNDSEGHQLRIADVNHDGKDDLVRIGGVVADSNGVPVTLYSTECAHGDRYHVTDIDPDRPGLEMYSIQQLNSTLLATELQDMGSGQLYKKWYSPGIVDVGRGVTLDMDPNHRGCELYSTQPGIFDAKGSQIFANNIWPPEAIWWDADLQREFEDGAGSGALNPVINKFDPASGTSGRLYTLYNEDGGCHQAYGGRAAFWGDILGDWREEFMVMANDYSQLRIYTTKIAATNRIYCLMQNPQYRVQCTFKGYYQASYVDYFLGYQMPPPPPPPVSDARLVWRGNGTNVWDAATANWFTNNLWISNTIATTYSSGDTVLFDMTGSNTTVALSGSLAPGWVTVHSPKDYTFDGGNGSLDGAMKLTKAGAGKLIFTGTNHYSGPTLVGEGSLIVNGALPSSPVTVRGGIWLDGRLGGTGVVGSAVSLNEGAGVSPGQGTNSPGTLTIANNVTLTGRTLNEFDLSDNPAGPNDRLAVNGNLILQGTNAIVIRKLNATLSAGSVYPLITYSGTLSGGLNNLMVVGLPGIPVALTNPPGQIALVIRDYRAPNAITWTGGSGGNAWDLLTSSNWLNGAVKDQFAPLDSVRFDNTGASNLTVNLSGDLNAASVIVDSTANYTLTGSGGIIGAASLTKSNSGTLTISALNNAFTGKTTVAGGTLVVSELDAIGFPSPLGNPPGGSTNLVLSGNSTLRITGESYTDRGLTLNAGTNTIEIPNGSDQVTIAGQIIGSGGLVKAGAGALALTVANTYSGNTVINAGSIALGSVAGNQTGIGTGSITFNNGTLSMINLQASETAAWNIIVPSNSVGRVDCDGRCTLTGSLTGGGTLTVMTPYVRTDFSGNWSAFTGQLNVIADSDGGDFRCNNSAGYPNAKVNLANLVSLQNRVGSTPTISIGQLSGAAGCSASAGGGNSGLPVNWSVGGLNTSATFAGNAYNGIGFIKVGTGTWTWTGTNAHTGQTTVNGGTLLINGNAATASGAVTVAASGTLGGNGIVGGVTTVNGRLSPGTSIGVLSFSNNLSIAASGSALIEISKSPFINDLVKVQTTLTYGGMLIVTNVGGGTLANGDSFKIFDAATYAGSFSSYTLPPLTGGLSWNTAALTTSGTLSVISQTNTAAPAAPNGLIATAVSASQINLSWTDNSTNENNFLIERSLDNLSFAQVISVGAGVTNAADTGLSANTLFYYRVRAGNDAGFSSYSGVASATTLIVPASLVWRGDGAGNLWDVGVSSNWLAGATRTTFTDGIPVLVDDSGSNNVAISLSGTISPAAVQVSANKNYTFGGSGSLAGAMTLSKTGSGTLTLSSANAYSGGTQVGGGTLALAIGTAAGTNTVTLSNSATLNLSAASVFTAVPVAVAAGASASLNSANLANAYSGPFSSGDSDSMLLLIGPISMDGQNLKQFQGFNGTVQINSGAQLRFSKTTGVNNGGDNTTFVANGTLNTRNGGAVAVGELAGNGSLSGGGSGAGTTTFTIGAKGSDSTFTGTISDANATGITALVKTGGGTLILSGTSTYSGVTTISGGTLQIGDNGTTGTLGTNNVINNARLAFNRADALSDRGIISGTGSLGQIGDGTLTLSTVHTYTGATTIESGTLALAGNGSITSSTNINLSAGALFDVAGRSGGGVTLASGQTLSGNGSIIGSVTLAGGATLAPGNSLGTLTFYNSLTLSAGSTTKLELTKAPLTNDVLTVQGLLNYGGALVVTNIGGQALAAGDSFPLLNMTSHAGSFSSLTLPALTANLAWDTNSFLASGTLTVVSTAPPAFGSIAPLGDGNFRLTFTGPTGRGYELRSTTNLSLTPVTLWELLASDTFGNDPVIFDDLSATNYPQRFYQIRVP